MSVEQKLFGKTKDGREAYLFTLKNAKGMEASVTNFGANWVTMLVPDRSGDFRDVVLGYDELSKYETNFDMLGAVVGRCVNRTEKGTFTLDGKTYHLEINENDNNIHSSSDHGFHKVLWDYEVLTDDSVTFRYFSPDGECGFPGNLKIAVTYTLTDSGCLILSYDGICDQRSIINITNHAYFNLDGIDGGSILDTLVQINADAYTPVREGIIPTGEIRPVEGTAFDFRTEKSIGQDYWADDEQLRIVHDGYDHNFCIRGQESGLRKSATARSAKSGIRMTMYQDLPGLQFYTSNTTRDIIGKGGYLITRNRGFCMESHGYTNAINTPNFPSPIMEANARYRTTTIYQFDVM